MGCCNILTGYAPPRTPPSLNDFPIYIDRLHKEVWYWTGTGWEIIWQVSVSIATDTTAGVVKVSHTSPITIDAEGFLGIDCTRLKAQCKFVTRAELDAAIALLRTQFAAEISRLDASIASIKTSIGEILVRLGDIDKRITALTTTVTDLSTRVSRVEGAVTTLTTKVTDLSTRVTRIEGDIVNIKGSVTDLGTRVTRVEGDIVTIKGAVTDLGTRVTRVEGDVTTIKGAVTDINTRITNISNGGNAAAADIAALKAKDIYLENLIKNLNPRVDYAVTASGTATTSLKGYTVTWTVFSSPNSNVKKCTASVCALPSTEVLATAGVESVTFAVPATAIISYSANIGSLISPSVPTATMGFNAFVANGNLGVSFKHVLGSQLGCHGHIMCVEYI